MFRTWRNSSAVLRGIASLLILVTLCAGCTDSRGLILKGKVGLVVVPEGQEVWLGLWVNDPTMQSEPVATAPMSDILNESDGGLNNFVWRTEIVPADRAYLYVGGYMEQAATSDGYPDRDATVHPADENPLIFTDENIVSVGNGAWEFKDLRINIDFSSDQIVLEDEIKVLAESMIEVLTYEAATVDQMEALIHPFYEDPFGNDYETIMDWFSGENTNYSMQQLPLYGRFHADQASKYKNYQFADISSLTFKQTAMDIENGWFSYTRGFDNITLRTRFSVIGTAIEDGKAYIREFRPSHTVLDSDGTVLVIQSIPATSILAPTTDVPYKLLWKTDVKPKDGDNYYVALRKWDDNSSYWRTVTEYAQPATGFKSGQVSLEVRADPCNLVNPGGDRCFTLSQLPELDDDKGVFSMRVAITSATSAAFGELFMYGKDALVRD